MDQYYWRLPDGTIWGFAEAGWVTEVPEGYGADPVADQAALVARIIFYGGSLGVLETDEQKYNAERAAVEAKYTAPWNGSTGGILDCTQKLMMSALCKTPQDADEIAAIAAQYQAEQANMYAEFDAIDQKYGAA